MTLVQLKLWTVTQAVNRLERLGWLAEEVDLGTPAEKPRVIVGPASGAPLALIGAPIDQPLADGRSVRMFEVRWCNCRVQWRAN